MAQSALEGVRVIELGRFAVGPLTAKYLADYGAQVVKVEHFSSLDVSRLSSPFIGGKAGVNRSGNFAPFNSGKLSVTLNLKHPEGLQLFLRLIKQSDALVSNFTFRALRGLGITYENLARVKPDLILMTMPVEGATGPHRDYMGWGPTLEALTGTTAATGWPGAEPILPNTSITDYTGPVFGCFALLAALDYRARTGQGQHIDFSQLEVGIHCTATAPLDYSVNRREPAPQGNRQLYPPAAPHGVYRCRGEDRWCCIAVFTDQEWEACVAAIGTPAWARVPQFATLSQRLANCEALDHHVESWTRQHTPEEVMMLLQAAGVAAGVVESSKDLVEWDPQLKHRGHFVEAEVPDLNAKVLLERPAFRLSGTPSQIRGAPFLGEHDTYAYEELLGLSDENLLGLMERGVIGVSDLE